MHEYQFSQSHCKKNEESVFWSLGKMILTLTTLTIAIAKLEDELG